MCKASQKLTCRHRDGKHRHVGLLMQCVLGLYLRVIKHEGKIEPLILGTYYEIHWKSMFLID